MDNIPITPGSGATVATDEVNIGGANVHVQRIKVVLGTDGVYQRDLATGQATRADSLPVTIASDQGVISPTHTFVNVSTTSTLALAANNARRYALFINDSDTTMYLGLGSAAQAHRGIRLNANGGAYEMSAESGNLYLGPVYVIHDGNNYKMLLVTEGV
jgi:hypothetical protein